MRGRWPGRASPPGRRPRVAHRDDEIEIVPGQDRQLAGNRHPGGLGTETVHGSSAGEEQIGFVGLTRARRAARHADDERRRAIAAAVGGLSARAQIARGESLGDPDPGDLRDLVEGEEAAWTGHVLSRDRQG